MEFRIWVETRLAGRMLERELVVKVKREALEVGPEEIGLSLDEGKAVLRQVQTRIIRMQVDALEAAHRKCGLCGRNQSAKDVRTRCVRTVFGAVRVSCRRYLRCTCQGGKRTVLWPIHSKQLPGTTPELDYLYATWGSSVPYRRAAAVLGDLLPICTGSVSHATLRRRTLAVGARLDQRVTEPDEYDWPESKRAHVPAAKNLNVAIDGTYIRADRTRGLREYHVVASRIEREGQLGGHFAWIAQHRLCDAGRFMRAALQANGWTEASQVRVLADGADGLTNLVSAAAEKTALRVLDWFHISMRLRPIEQMSSGIAITVSGFDSVLKALINEKLPRIRHQMWNGQWHAALDRMREIYRASKRLLESLSTADAERAAVSGNT